MTADFEGRHFVFLIGYIGQLGGAERQALIVANMLREKAGARVSFLGWSVQPGIMTDKLNAAQIPIYSYPLDWGHRLTWRKSRVAKAYRLSRFARFTGNTVKPDYLLPYVSENSKVAGLIWRKVGARYTWWNQRDEGRELFGSRLERRILRTVPDVVSNSFEGRQFLVDVCGVPFDRVRVINNAIPLPTPSDGLEWRARLDLRADDKLMLMVANLTRFKDHATLVKAFAKLQAARRDAKKIHLAFAGRLDETASELKAMAFDLGLASNLHFLGAVTDMNPLYDAADLVVHSSMKEGCPNAVLEGMAHARCVVGTDISGMRQALGPDADDFLAPAMDVDALASRMQNFLDDDEARTRVGLFNRERIATEFSPERHFAAVIEGIAARQLPAK